MPYNYLKEARTIRNSTLCLNDTLLGYSVDLARNGDVDGWDIYNNVHLYGCWSNVLFGSMSSTNSYIQRSNNFLPIEAEEYYTIVLVMKLTPLESKPYPPTTGRIMWTRTDNSTWEDHNSIDFDLDISDNWYRYTINLGPERWWQGTINNLRIYPALDGHRGCKFAFKEISIVSHSNYKCRQTNCSYFLNYSHPCKGSGKAATATSSENKKHYTTIEGVSDSLVLNIDNYGDYSILLGSNYNLTILNICKLLEQCISTLGIGGYNYVEVTPTIDNKIEIKSGTVGERSDVSIIGGSAALELTFDIEHTKTLGQDSASHYNAASSFRLNMSNILSLLEYSETAYYTNDPNTYSVEVGNRDFFKKINSNKTSKKSVTSYLRYVANAGTTIIDISHPVTSTGNITDLYLNCSLVPEGASVFFLSPHMDGSYTVMSEVPIPTEVAGVLYSANQTSHHISCDVRVVKGDVIAVYGAALAVLHKQPSGDIDACFFSYLRKPKGRFFPGAPKSKGTVGFHIYARGDRKRDNLLLDIDLGSRVNASSFFIKAEEYSSVFEYNLAICEDLNWNVDCFDDSHDHITTRGSLCTLWQKYTHKNLYFGIECLDDGISSPTGTKQGDSFSKGSNGIETIGAHDYFYVNGDAEWGLGTPGSSPETSAVFEFDSPPYCSQVVDNYKYDPIEFSLNFPGDNVVDIHKTIIYFKDGKNFKSFSQSYYVNSVISQKTGQSVGFKYINNINTVTLDGYEFNETNNSEPVYVTGRVKDYLFVNPTPSVEPIYINSVCTNWGVVQTAMDLTWNILEFNFDKVACSGYKLLVNHHISTKITEFEVYSSFPLEPSVLDNMSLDISIDNNTWQPVAFDTTGKPFEVEAVVSISPRFMRLKVASQDLLSLFGFLLEVTDTVKGADCSDTIALDFFKDPDVSEVTSSVFTNTYNSLSDFSAYLPTGFIQADIKTVDINFSGEAEDVTNVIIRKNPDLNLFLENSQVAINCQSYGLVNLIDNKKSYIYLNEYEGWQFYKTLTHGESLNENFPLELEYTYLIFETLNTKVLYLYVDSEEYELSNIYLYSKGKLLRNYSMRIGATLKNTGSGLRVTSTGNEISKFDDFDIINDVFLGEYIDSSKWSTTHTTGVYENSIDVTGGFLYPKVFFNKTYVGLKSTFDNTSCFYFEAVVNLYKYINSTNYDNKSTHIKFKFSNNLGDSFYLIYRRNTATGGSGDAYLVDNHNNWIFLFNNVAWLGNPQKVKITVKNSDIRVVLVTDGITNPYVDKTIEDFIDFPISKLECVFINDSDTLYSGFNYLYIDNVLLKVLNVLTSNDHIIVSFNTTTEVDRVKCLADKYIANIDIKFNNSFEYNKLVYSSELLKIESLHSYTYIAIDLEERHALDFIRNYGNMQDKLYLNLLGSYISLSSTDTSSIQDVDWWYSYDVSITLFNDIDYSTNFSDYKDTTRIYINNKVHMSTLEYISGSSSGYFNGSSFFQMECKGDFEFGYNSFGISLFVFMLSSIIEDKHLVGKWSGSYSYSLGITKDRKIFFKYTDGSSTNTVYSDVTLVVGKWVNIQVNRQDWNLYIFIDGKLSGLFDIGIFYIKSNASNLYVGGLPDSPSSNFYGYIDNLHVRKGKPINVSDFTVSTYNNSLKIANLEEYRWLRINIPTTGNKSLDKLGLYPNIERPLLSTGGFNCTWQPLGQALTNYFSSPINITTACIKTVATSSIENCDASNTITGDRKGLNYEDCWGFDVDDLEPTLTLLFDKHYTISSIDIYHGLKTGSGYFSEDFKVNGYTTSSGLEYTELFSITGNTSEVTTHTFDTVTIEKLEFIITKYISGEDEIPRKDESGFVTYTTLSGGFIREFEAYTPKNKETISSEDYPVVCIDLIRKFNVSNFSFYRDGLFPSNQIDGALWLSYAENKFNYIKYSDVDIADPKKVAFFSNNNEFTYLNFPDAVSTNMLSASIYILDNSLFLDAGAYDLNWYAFNNTTSDLFYLQIIGPDLSNKFFPVQELKDAWTFQQNTLIVKTTGLFKFIFGITSDDLTDDDGNMIICSVKDITIKRTLEYTRWVCAIDNTATDYSFDANVDNAHPHYVKEFKINSGSIHQITESSNWWKSSFSTLSTSVTRVLVDKASLKIAYAKSTKEDSVEFIEGDSFYKDAYWLEKDFLRLNLYISDVNNLDVSYGGIGFGCPNGYDPNGRYRNRNRGTFAYAWDFSEMSLHSGWNKLKLQFSKYSTIFPINLNSKNSFSQEKDTEVRNAFLAGFMLNYRGTGIGDLSMYIENIGIKRCLYEEKVLGENSLCLSYAELVEVPLSNLTISKGTVSFFAKMYNNSVGLDLFDRYTSRTFFSVTSPDNDIVTFGLKSGKWFEFGVGDVSEKYVTFSLTGDNKIHKDDFLEYDEPFHITVMWDNKGNMSNGDSFRLYFNGKLTWYSKFLWNVSSDAASRLILGGGAPEGAFNNESSGAAIFKNLKVYNYCIEVSDYTAKIGEDLVTYDVNDFVYLSLDNINFYGRHASVMPLTVSGVAPLEEVTLYVKSIKNKEFRKLKNKSANLLIDWIVTV